MVSGRAADAVANCKQCGKELILFAYADRQELVCPACETDNAPVQLPLFPRFVEKNLKVAEPKQEVEPISHYMKCEGCMNPDCEASANNCNCCNWIPNTAFYWDGYGICCQMPTSYILQRLFKQHQRWSHAKLYDDVVDADEVLVIDEGIQLSLFLEDKSEMIRAFSHGGAFSLWLH